MVFGYTQMLVLVASGALYSCDTGFDGYAAGLGGAEGADAYVPNREKQLGRPAASREAALAPDVVGGPLAGKRVAAMDAGDATASSPRRTATSTRSGAARWAARDATANRGW